MKHASPLIVAILLSLGMATASAQSNATTPVDATRTNAQFIPETTVTPEVKDKKTAARLQSKRFQDPRSRQVREKKPAPAADKRSNIELKETREKNVRDKKEITVEKRTPEKSLYDGKRSRIQTSDLFDTTRKTNRFQSYIKDAVPLTKTSEPYIEKRASLDTINRFAFRRNGIPASDKITVTPAGDPLRGN
ncbi:hypothetical protein Ga0100231_018010 [Opitutaceae bacterium TAV4]|nr:hypothetical protein Ga0100231_018010 [Opitutaceae bacterium TAV4]RRK00030.1 hypothetical protein Ga0100230_018690 [Opitutaceae bacterium TAV3]